ncbi:CoA-disulfide reductase [Sporosarcina sp. G11-34]|uniref:CoA-disulfide reductase n=1 Tax=Sporosarcina sp. G11-34 TaxID=2849605 RepID=UPI0022A8FC9F|nr:CoA-disulfide reductase [Sporosarcina sp. G11-34]MCZ2259002.1 CoA-disulfide reductase [Sporosarcina sp. G11-34]
MKVIVIGAIAGGSTVASQIRRAVPHSEIVLIGRDPEIGYGTCGMPYVIGGLIEDKKRLIGTTAEKFSESKNIKTLVRHEVFSINRKDKTVEVHNLDTHETFTESYDKLILSPGGYSRVPELNGIKNLPLFTLKSYADMEEIIEYIQKEKPKSCAVIGGGFIGVEFAENFIRLGLKTALIERNDRVMKVMDIEVTDILNQEMKDNGVELYFNDAIERIEGKTLMMKNGVNIDVDFIAASVGIIPDTKIATDAGLSIGSTKGIVVNKYMQTDDPDIYAIGDAAECTDWVTGKPKRVQLAWHAHRQAYIVACHLEGKPVALNGFLGSTITKLFSLTAAMTGHSAKSLDSEGIAYKTVQHKGRSNAGYYPDHGTIYLRVHYDSESRLILGAQAVGDKGVDKRIDVITTAIMGKMTVDDLSALELSYSPPYSSPKDPVNMLGYKAT